MNNEIQLLAALAGLPAGNLPQNPSDLKKALTTAAGFLGINLEPQAKWLQPFFAGLRKRMPTNTPALGAAQAQWRMQLGYGGFSFGAAASFGTAFGANGPATTESALTILADYCTQSINGGVQFEAIVQAQGWDNAMNLDTMNALSLLMRIEEFQVLYGNRAALPVAVASGNPSTLVGAATFGAGTWSVIVTAITGQGTLTNATANSNVGESNISNFVDIVVPAGGCAYLDVSWVAVPGALGYKVYANRVAGGGHTMATLFLARPGTDMNYAAQDGAGSFLTTLGTTLTQPAGQTYIPVNHVQIKTIIPNTQPIAVNADASANTNVFEGVVAWCEKNTIYGQDLTGGAVTPRVVTDQGGLPLTVQSTGIKEFDAILQTQWVQNHTSPSLILCSANSIVSVANKIASAGNNNQFRLDVYQDRNNIVGGLYVGGYVNKFTSSMINMQQSIEMWAHPYMPDGTFLFVSEDVPPETLPYSRVGKTFELDVPIPYTYFELGRTDRSFPYDVFYNETLKCYWPTAQSAIVGVRVDS